MIIISFIVGRVDAINWSRQNLNEKVEVELLDHDPLGPNSIRGFT